eukprot:6207255-Pleurochrysis_carterae.AAC.2
MARPGMHEGCESWNKVIRLLPDLRQSDRQRHAQKTITNGEGLNSPVFLQGNECIVIRLLPDLRHGDGH